MIQLYVRVTQGCRNLVNRLLREEEGLTAIEYAVFAAFIVLALAGIAMLAGPTLKEWFGETICDIMGKTYNPNAGGGTPMCS